jgi:hypothetical protein
MLMTHDEFQHESRNMHVCPRYMQTARPFSYRFLISNRFLRYSPYLSTNQGAGIMRQAMNPRRLLPQPRPSLSNMGNAANGITAPKIDRTRELDARADAA